MIFGRRKNASDEPEENPVDAPEETLDADDEPETENDADTEPETGAEDPRWRELDASQDWRHDGPFDFEEVDLSADDVPRLDLGTLILTPEDGMQLQLQLNEETQQVVSVMVMMGDSALDLSVFAAPRSGGLWAELRPDIIAATEEMGGSASLAEGPFGTELRRLITVNTDEGEGYQPSRTWVVEGPRWMLRGTVYGQAALADGLEPPADAVHDVFCNLVVRRGDDARAAGDVIPLTLPEGLEPAED